MSLLAVDIVLRPRRNPEMLPKERGRRTRPDRGRRAGKIGRIEWVNGLREPKMEVGNRMYLRALFFVRIRIHSFWHFPPKILIEFPRLLLIFHAFALWPAR